MLDTLPPKCNKNWMFFPETTAFLSAFEKVNLVSSHRAFWSCFYGHNPLSILFHTDTMVVNQFFLHHFFPIYKGGEGGQ